MITKTYPVAGANVPITVFMNPALAPTDSESLGVVSITDTGFSTKCDSVTVVELLKEEARKAGGNAVVVTEYIRPSIWRSMCHQMAGTVLRVRDFNSVAQTADGDSVQLMAVKVIQPKRKLPEMTLSANIGYGWRTAKLEDDPASTAYAKAYYEELLSGLVTDASFNYYFNDYYGVGLIYSAYSANNSQYSTDRSGESDYWKTNSVIRFIGPTFLMRMPLGNPKWLLDCNLGIGYLGYSLKETFASQSWKVYGSTVGSYLSLGAEYKVDEHWAIGARLSEVVGVLGTWTEETNGVKEIVTVSKPSEARIGLTHLQPMVGIRYYIK
ncbi:hypothetical protein AGMMS4957_04530 [Bacteroidia bacterium]|nr:hypothetical protein AGMMS4957_04530 [Bacteroidia bacterium]